MITGVEPGITGYYEEMKGKTLEDFKSETAALVPEMSVPGDFAFASSGD